MSYVDWFQFNFIKGVVFQNLKKFIPFLKTISAHPKNQIKSIGVFLVNIYYTDDNSRNRISTAHLREVSC